MPDLKTVSLDLPSLKKYLKNNSADAVIWMMYMTPGQSEKTIQGQLKFTTRPSVQYEGTISVATHTNAHTWYQK